MTWYSHDDGTSIGNDIYGRIYNADGTAIGNDFRVNTTTTGEQVGANIKQYEKSAQ